jgi:glucokinase
MISRTSDDSRVTSKVDVLINKIDDLLDEVTNKLCREMYGGKVELDRYILVDIGATYTRLAYGYEENGRPILDHLEKYETPDNPDSLVEVISQYAERMREFSSVSIASIGPLDVWKGWILETPNKKLGPYPIKPALEELIGVSVHLLNDCQAAVWGEYWYGRNRGTRNMVYITFSTGIGAGVLVDGRLLLGKKGNAHEVGHMVLDYNTDIKCGCGGIGHWEAFAGGGNIPRVTRVLLEDYTGPRTRFYNRLIAGDFTVKELFDKSDKGDPAAKYVVDRILRISAAGIASVIAVYDPEVLVLGGTVFHRGLSNYMDKLKSLVDSYSVFRDVKIESATFPGMEPLIGAFAAVMHSPIYT